MSRISHVRAVVSHRTFGRNLRGLHHGHVISRLLGMHQFLQLCDIITQIEENLVKQLAFILKAVRLIAFGRQRHNVVGNGVVGNIPGQNFRRDCPLRRQNRNLLRHVLQLPHIARPWVFLQLLLCCFRQFHRLRHIIFLRRVHGKLLEQEHHVAAPLAQGGHLDGNRVQPIKQILAEAAVTDGLRHVDVRGRHDAHISLAHVTRPHTDVFPRLQHTQQTSLGGQRQLPHLVQEQRASVCRTEISFTLPDGAGERPLFMAEQLGVNRALGNGATVHGKVFFRLPQTVVVNDARNNLLAHPAFSGNQHGQVGLCHLQGNIHGVVQSFRIAHDAISPFLCLNVGCVHIFLLPKFDCGQNYIKNPWHRHNLQ